MGTFAVFEIAQMGENLARLARHLPGLVRVHKKLQAKSRKRHKHTMDDILNITCRFAAQKNTYC